MKLEKLIAIALTKESVTILGQDRNQIHFIGSNLTTPVTAGTAGLSEFSLKWPGNIARGVVALKITEVDSRGHQIQNYRHFLAIDHDGIGKPSLDMFFTPPANRMAHIEDDRIVGLVGEQLVASSKKDGARRVNANQLCAWIAEEIYDEDLLIYATELHEEETAQERLHLIEHKIVGFRDQIYRLEQKLEAVEKDRAIQITQKEELCKKIDDFENALLDIYRLNTNHVFVSKKLKEAIDAVSLVLIPSLINQHVS